MIDRCFCDFREMGVAEHQERQVMAEAKSHGSSCWLVALQGLMVSCSSDGAVRAAWTEPLESPPGAVPGPAQAGRVWLMLCV